MDRTYQLVATFAIVFGFFSLGMIIASLGPSLLGLERQTGASAETLSLVFTSRSLGYLLGSVLGGVLLDRCPPRGNRIISFSLFLTCGATALVPLAGTVVVLAALVSTQGFAMGMLDTIGNVLLLNLHGDHAAPWDGRSAMTEPLRTVAYDVRLERAVSARLAAAQARGWLDIPGL